MRLIANFLSAILHPLILPTYAAVIVILANPSVFDYLGINPEILLIRVAINTFVFPLLIILIAIPLGFVSNLKMEDRQERIIPYIITLFFYIWSFFSFFKEGITPPFFNVILLGAMIATIIAFLTNILYFKVSVHTVGMGVLIGLVLSMVPISEKNLIPILLVLVLLAGAIGTARLLLNSHSQQEIYIGYLLGLFSQLLAIQILM